MENVHESKAAMQLKLRKNLNQEVPLTDPHCSTIDLLVKRSYSIKLRHLTQETIEIFNAENEFLGRCNSELTFYDFLCQIKHEKLEGYYIKRVSGEKLTISNEGKLSYSKDALYPEIDMYLNYLLDVDSTLDNVPSWNM